MARAQSGALSAIDIAHGQFLASSVGTLDLLTPERALVRAVAVSESASSPGSPALNNLNIGTFFRGGT